VEGMSVKALVDKSDTSIVLSLCVTDHESYTMLLIHAPILECLKKTSEKLIRLYNILDPARTCFEGAQQHHAVTDVTC